MAEHIAVEPRLCQREIPAGYEFGGLTVKFCCRPGQRDVELRELFSGFRRFFKISSESLSERGVSGFGCVLEQLPASLETVGERLFVVIFGFFAEKGHDAPHG